MPLIPALAAFSPASSTRSPFLLSQITPPIIISSSLNLPSETQSYLISASLIACGILSAVQMSAIPLLRGYQLGTGLLSVVGTSFATLSTATAIFDNLFVSPRVVPLRSSAGLTRLTITPRIHTCYRYKDGTCPTITLADGTTSRGACPEAYGYLIGTAAVCGLLEMALSFVPVRLLRKAFPPVVTGGVVTLIGASLIGSSGFLDWAGGSGDCSSRPTSGQYVVCPQVGGPHALPWGSAEYLGLGFLSFMTIVVVEIFGSPVMRNGSVVIGLLFPLVVAGPLGYIGRSNIDSAQAITFLWTTTFKLKVYGPAVLVCIPPLLAPPAFCMGSC